ncbi:MAG TPA: SDR family NAD(P)-dependent oxidoreductase [Caulobacteraceae bacterium]|jgi:short-subunit dehydrogenase|nr:SDR family NAD(P)-dependent oxidoreductase [Caulobacteraceae bacterium]
MTSLPKGRAAITGASSGIGASYAERLASRGYALLLIARRADRLEALAKWLTQAHGVDVETLVADLEDPAALATVEARVGKPDVSILVNNAGAGGLGPSAQVTADQIERTLRLNIVALSRLSHAALANFRADGRGLLVNIGSVMAHAPSPSGAAYSGSKAYVLNFTRSLQVEHKAYPGVQIQLVMPGPIRTEFFSSQGLSDSVFPDSSYLTPDQLVDAALAGADAGELITIPSMADRCVWDRLEEARLAFMGTVSSGAVAPRYLQPEAAPA